jgi:hypothetical protein
MTRGLGLAGALLAAFSFLACSGSTTTIGSPGNSSVSGTVSGQPVATVDTVGLSGTELENGVTVSYVGAVITNLPGTCATLQSAMNAPNVTALTMVVAAVEAVAPGTYAVTTEAMAAMGETAQAAEALYVADDSSCQATSQVQFDGGSITLTNVSASLIEGSFSLTSGAGAPVTGQFSAPVCPVDISTIASMTSGACK